MSAEKFDRRPLTSWKEIAAFAHTSVRTVQRWEHDKEFPVRRPVGRGIVLALPDEIDEWFRSHQNIATDPVPSGRDVLMAAGRRLVFECNESREQSKNLRLVRQSALTELAEKQGQLKQQVAAAYLQCAKLSTQMAQPARAQSASLERRLRGRRVRFTK